MKKIEKTVFICYRRTNSAHARLMYQTLTKDGYDVFLDYESIDSGSFEQHIIKQIRARAHFLIILTPSALVKCYNPKDIMRMEIETAIDSKRNILPLFFDEFRFDKCDHYLEGKLKLLHKYNGIEISFDYFKASIDKLEKRYLNSPLESILHPLNEQENKKLTSRINKIERYKKRSQKALKSELLHESGWKNYLIGDTEGSLKDFNESIKLNNRNPQTFSKISEIYNYILEDKKALFNIDKAISLLEENDPEVHKYRCKKFLVISDFKKGFEEAQKYIDILPRDPDGYNLYGRLCYETKDYAQAIDFYGKALHLDPEGIFYLHNRGLARWMGNDFEGAINDCKRALTINPKFDNAYNTLGLVFSSKGDYKTAIEYYDKALSINKKNFRAYANRGFSKSNIGHTDSALKDCDKSLSLKSDWAYGFVLRGHVKANEDILGALSDYKKAIELNPYDDAAYPFLANLLIGLSDFKGAIDNCYKSIHLNPNDYFAFYVRGLAYSKIKKYDLALMDYNESIRLNPKDAYSYAERANLFLEIGEFKKAEKDCNKALSLNINGTAYVHSILNEAKFQIMKNKLSWISKKLKRQ